MPRPSPQTDRVVAVLNLLADTNDVGATLTEIARRLSVNRATCVHMLAALEASGFVVRGPADRRYHLGPSLITLGSAAGRRYPGFDAARPEIDDLTRATGHPCFAFALERDHARLLYYTWDLRRPAPAIHVGDTLPLVPPIGAVFFAWAEESEIDKWVARAPREGDRGARLRDMLAAIRKLGYVVELQPPSTMLQALGGRGHAGARLPLSGGDGHDFVVTCLVDDDEYSLSSISVPVIETSGRVTIALNIGGFASPLSGADIRLLAAAARAAADRVVTEAPSTAPVSPSDTLTG